MFHRMNRPSLQSSHKILCILTVHLLLTHSCRGQSQLIGSSQPIVATVGDDIILPCQLQPAEDVAALAVEWTRSDLDSIFVHVRRAGQDVIAAKHPSYQGRTSVSIDRLKQGNISLKLSKVKLSDEGKYRCFILQLDTQSFVELVVASDAVSPPVISVAAIDRVRGEVVLQCGSKGWHPEPDVFWRDSEGNFLSAETTKTVRGPDGLYTVSSRVTVEKSHSNNFTCRVKQNKINQIRETHFIVPDDLFKAPPSSSPVIIGVAVSLVVCIVVVVAVFFFVWKWKQNKTKETVGRGNKNLSKSDDPEMHHLNPAGTSQLERDQTAPVQSSSSLTQAGKNSTESPVNVEVSPSGKFIRLTTKSKEDLKLEGWGLRVKVNDQNPIMYTFEESITLRAGRSVTIFVPGCGRHFPPYNLTWKDLNRWTKGDKLLVKLINCHEEIVKTTEKDKSLHDENNDSNTSSQLEEKPEEDDERKTDEEEQENKETQAGKNSTEVFVKVNPSGKYLRLTTKSKEDLKLEGWKLRVKVNDENPIMYTFEKSIKLRAKENVLIWADGCGAHSPPSDLVWMELKRWTKGDKLLVELINCDGEIVKTTEV